MNDSFQQGNNDDTHDNRVFPYNSKAADSTRRVARIKLVFSDNQWFQTAKVFIFVDFVCNHNRYKLRNT